MSVYFDNIVGNDKLKSMLSSYIEAGSLPHAFVIEGPRGSGKKLIAKSVCAAVSCKRENTESVPCKKCINCEKIFSDVSPDVIIIDKQDKNTIGVDVVRDIKSHTYISSNELDIKAYIIDEADKLTEEAQNAFLKILEEPVTDVLFFLLCENSGLLLPTIISRAPVLRTAPVSRALLSEYIKSSHPSFDYQRIEMISALAHGNIGAALLYSNDSPELEDAQQMRKKVYELLSIISEKKSKYEYMNFFTKLSYTNQQTIDFLNSVYTAMRDIISHNETKSFDFDFFINEEDLKRSAKNIKSKFSKKLCLQIESTVPQLMLNSGPSSTNSIMLSFSLKAWNIGI